MMFRRVCASALLVAMPAFPVMADVNRAFDRECWERHEIAAAKIQRFKTMLLVGSLNCRDLDPYVMTEYNIFLRAQRGVINANQRIVRDRFDRKYGPSYGLTAFSDYETQLGNQMSSAHHGRQRCAMIASYARLAARVSPDGLTDLAHSTGGEEPLRACGPAMHYAAGRWQARPAAAPPPPAFATAAPPVTIAAAPPPPPPVPAAPTQTVWPDLAPVEPEVHPVAVEPNSAITAARAQVAAAAPRLQQAAAAPRPDAAEALRAAIKSLTAAAEALEAERAGAPATQ